MSIEVLIIYFIGTLFFGGACFVLGYFIRKRFAERLIRTAESKAREILVGAKRESEETLKRADKDAKQLVFKLQSEYESKVAQNRRDLENREKVLRSKEDTLGDRINLVEKKERETNFKFQEAAAKEKAIVDKE